MEVPDGSLIIYPDSPAMPEDLRWLVAIANILETQMTQSQRKAALRFLSMRFGFGDTEFG